MIYHGHVTHPDLWMMWYAVWFCAVLTLYSVVPAEMFEKYGWAL